jgi:hypothetical protein
MQFQSSLELLDVASRNSTFYRFVSKILFYSRLFKIKNKLLKMTEILLLIHIYLCFIYSERQKYGINSLKIKQNFFQKNLWTDQF